MGPRPGTVRGHSGRTLEQQLQVQHRRPQCLCYDKKVAGVLLERMSLYFTGVTAASTRQFRGLQQLAGDVPCCLQRVVSRRSQSRNQLLLSTEQRPTPPVAAAIELTKSLLWLADSPEGSAPDSASALRARFSDAPDQRCLCPPAPP